MLCWSHIPHSWKSHVTAHLKVVLRICDKYLNLVFLPKCHLKILMKDPKGISRLIQVFPGFKCHLDGFAIQWLISILKPIP